MSDRTPPQFVDADPAKITAANIEFFEAITGRTLQPAQVERLLIDVISYDATLVREALQYAAEQNLVAFAEAPALDYLGELVGVRRLEASPARTTVNITLSAIQPTDRVIGRGARVATADGAVVFATEFDLIIKAGDLSGDVQAVAEGAGSLANGYLPGQVDTLLDAIALVASVANTTTSSGGADGEADDALRNRIIEAPNAFSVAGPVGGYRSLALGVHPDITDISVWGPTERDAAGPGDTRLGEVDIYVLTSSGVPSLEIIDLVTGTITGERARPVTDKVNVLAPGAVGYAVTVDLIITPEAVQADVEALVLKALQGLTGQWRASLGQDIIRSRLTAAIQAVQGVHAATLTAPLNDTVLASTQFADAGTITITTTGVSGG